MSIPPPPLLADEDFLAVAGAVSDVPSFLALSFSRIPIVFFLSASSVVVGSGAG